MTDDLKVGDVVAKPGMKSTGYFEAMRRMDGKPLNIAVLLANGSKAGPFVWVLGGLHGEEVWGTIAMQKVFRELVPSQMSGSIAFIPTVNPSSFWAKGRCSAEDGGDIERLFPGSPEGTYTERLAYSIYEKVSNSNADSLMTLHGHGSVFEIIDFTVFDYSDPKTKGANREASRAMNVDYAFGIPEPILGGCLINQCVSKLGMPSIMIEGNTVEFYAENLVNWFKHLGILPEKPAYRDKIRINKLVIMNSKHGGIFVSKVDLYTKIVKDQLLAEIVNFEGETVEELISPIDGMIMTIRRFPIVLPSWEDKLLDKGRKYPGRSWEDHIVFELAGLGTKEDW